MIPCYLMKFFCLAVHDADPAPRFEERKGGAKRAKQTAATNVRLSEDLKTRVLEVAQSNQMTISGLFRLALLTYLPEMERGQFRLRGRGLLKGRGA
jgi:hypothetical protein